MYIYAKPCYNEHFGPFCSLYQVVHYIKAKEASLYEDNQVSAENRTRHGDDPLYEDLSRKQQYLNFHQFELFAIETAKNRMLP